MKASLRSKLNLFVFIALAIVLLFFAFRGVDYEVMLKGFRNAKYEWVALAMLAGFIAHIFRALRWQIMIEPLGKVPSFKNTLSAIMVGYLANLAFPRIGEITRCISLRKTDGLPFESLLGTVIVERALDVLIMLILLITVLFVQINFFGEFLLNDVIVPLGQKFQSILSISPIIPIALLLVIVVSIVLLRRNVFGTKLRHRISALFWGVVDGLKSLLKTKRKAAFAGYTIAIWACYWLMTWLVFFAIDATAGLSPADGLFLLVVGSLGMAAPVQGGFGAFHVIVYMALGIYGISKEDGLIYATISHESQTLLVLALGAFFMLLLFFQQKKANLQAENTK